MKNTLYLFVCLATYQVNAQNNQEGKIIFQDQTPAAYLDLVILQDNNILLETSTDENGNFSTNLSPGNYQMLIEESGINLLTQDLIIKDSQNIGVIIISKDKILLKEVLVDGTKKLIEKKVDRLYLTQIKKKELKEEI